ncbi:hypothetical protein F4678DRAFT_18637 [Xylaria arbuscula]|nr:hypothetical protein F4678DRAFT_18637 [Xylaria arbuscula]
MRLLQINDGGTISLTKDLQQDLPLYAILSHTWGLDHQEVGFDDIRREAVQEKAGYQKIQFCQKQAARDELRYFWVDTCCIKHDSDVELTRSINSMYRWYRNAKKCYVYLSDVFVKGDGQLGSWEESFRRSRWFTRGWTLQEFFSSEGEFLGTKSSLEQQLHEITHIPVAALRGMTLSKFSIDERMSWSKNRETKLAEDEAYCLLGIFDIHMPLIYGEGQEHACARLRKELDGDQRQPRAFSTVPFARDPNFVHRPDILAWIDEKCDAPGARAALVGLGGIGKSQAIIEYAYRVRDDRPETWVFWVHASTTLRVEEAYRGIADRLHLPGRHKPNVNICQLVSHWLCDEMNGRWILILDNADNAETFFPEPKPEMPTPLGNFLPQSQNGSILVTSRSKDAALRLVGDLRNVMEVHAMSDSQANQLLRNKLHAAPDEDGMMELANALDRIPLAITQAAACINRRSHMTVSGYLDEFHRSASQKTNLLERDLGDLRRDGSVSNSIKTTWHLSFRGMYSQRSSAADLLSLMSFFHPQGIPKWVLRQYSKTQRPTDNDSVDDELEDDLELLDGFSFVTRTIDGDTCEVHALVQFCTRAWLSAFGQAEKWTRHFLYLMSKAFPTGDFQNRTKCRQLMPHLEHIHNQEPDDEEDAKEWAQLLTNVAWHMWHEGNYNTAEAAATKAFIVRERILGDDDMSTLTTMAVLASVLRGGGKYREAEKMNRQALSGYERALGQRHPDTLTSMSNLALVLRDQGKYYEAEKLHRQALEGRETELGTHHSDTLASMSHLALVYRDQGKYPEAETLNRRVLQGREELLGKKHPSTLTSASNLALVLYERGQYEESEELNRQTLKEREEVLGKQHYHTLTSMGNLAMVLQDRGKYNESETMNRHLLGIYEQELGMQHPNVLTSVSNLASVLQDQGKYEEAEELHRRSLGGRERVLGRKHPDSLTSLSNLAYTLRCQERFSESEALNRQALRGREVELGLHHPDTLTSMNNLALVLRDQQKYAEAERLSRRAAQEYRTKLGARHPHTLTSLNNLAAILQDQKKYNEAEMVNRRVLEAYEKELGKQHPDTLKSLSNLATIMHRREKYEAAERLHRRTLEGREQQLGLRHVDTIKSVSDLASVLRDQGKHDEAERLTRHT